MPLVGIHPSEVGFTQVDIHHNAQHQSSARVAMQCSLDPAAHLVPEHEQEFAEFNLPALILIILLQGMKVRDEDQGEGREEACSGAGLHRARQVVYLSCLCIHHTRMHHVVRNVWSL